MSASEHVPGRPVDRAELIDRQAVRSASSSVTGMVLLVASEAVFFAAFLGIYAVSYTRARVWPPAGITTPSIAVPTAGVLVLLVSGAAPRAAAFNMKDGTPAGEVTAAGELAGPPHVIGAAAAGLPMVVVAARDIAKGAIVSAMIRSVDPVMAPFSSLPNPLPALAPQLDVPTR